MNEHIHNADPGTIKVVLVGDGGVGKVRFCVLKCLQTAHIGYYVFRH